MKLKSLITLEIFSLVVILIIAMNIILVNPYLESSRQNSPLELLKEKEFAQGAIILERGQMAFGHFNYSSYEPSILVLDLTYTDLKTPGYVTIYCNGRFAANMLVTLDKRQDTLTIVSCSGVDWVRPVSTNAIIFTSEYEEGFEGNLTYVIRLRGSR